jgi:septal ring factor EnvC (AmiA/AmiB activator)
LDYIKGSPETDAETTGDVKHIHELQSMIRELKEQISVKHQQLCQLNRFLSTQRDEIVSLTRKIERTQ